MFLQRCVPLQGGARQALVQDDPKMHAIVERTAQFLSELLCLKNSNKATLADVAYRQMNYLPTPARVRQLDSLLQTYKFVILAEDLADNAYKTSSVNHGCNIRVSAYTSHQAYFQDEIITKNDGRNVSTYEVGKFGLQLMNEVGSLCMDWLEELDKVLSDAAGLERSEAASTEVAFLKEYLASAIAQRLCCVCDEDINNDEISTRVLEELIVNEFNDCKEDAMELFNADRIAINALRTLAQSPKSSEARCVLCKHLDALRGLVMDPPDELVTPESRGLMQLEVLSRALVPNLDIEVRVEMASLWSNMHGKAAAAAAQRALEKLGTWGLNVKPYSVIREVERRCTLPFALPKTRFINFNRKFVARPARNRRCALDERSMRCVRLLSCILEFAAIGVFERGVVAAQAITPVARDSIIVSRIAAQTIINVREACAIGKDIMEYLNVLYDPSGDYEGAIDKAVCALSDFSVRELTTVFDDSVGILRTVSDELAVVTRSKLPFAVPAGYTSIASDMLALLLPLVEQRRSACFIPISAPSNRMLDMLHTVRRTRDWTPLLGSLRLSLDDLRGSHPLFRKTLDSLHESGVLVKRTGGGKNRITYKFDTPTLVELFARSCSVS